MSESLVFRMGRFTAHFPTDRLYARNHMWAQRQPGGARFRCGLTAYAVRLLLDVYFLDWFVDPGAELIVGQEMGSIESKKAESNLYPPFAGRLTRLNEDLLADPSTINLDNYGKGWLFEIDGSGDDLLTPADYVEHLREVWKVTQQTIRGHLD